MLSCTTEVRCLLQFAQFRVTEPKLGHFKIYKSDMELYSCGILDLCISEFE